jgi:hypothetical protein
MTEEWTSLARLERACEYVLLSRLAEGGWVCHAWTRLKDVRLDMVERGSTKESAIVSVIDRLERNAVRVA